MVFLILIPALKILPGEIVNCRYRYCTRPVCHIFICTAFYRQECLTIPSQTNTVFWRCILRIGRNYCINYSLCSPRQSRYTHHSSTGGRRKTDGKGNKTGGKGDTS